MATTTNFGWETPDDTDLVKDGAAAIRTLGSAIDTSLVDLKGGTTNQVLAKNSNTDMDFKWVADATGIAATIFDAKGDLIAASAADTAARLAVGANGTVLTADSAEATGLKWATPSGGKIAQVVSAEITASTSSTSTSFVDATSFNLSITPTNASSKVLVIINACMGGSYNGDNSGQFDIRLVRGSTSVYEPNRNNWWEGGSSFARKYQSTVPLTYLDSPATTSSTTYKLQVRNQFGGSVLVNDYGNRSTITLLEVLP